MTPHYADDWLTVYHGDARAVLAELPAESVHCVVTSPPYWGLRDYGVSDQLGLEPTPEQYVENMVAVFREVRRVLRSDGTVWLNLGDSYASGEVGRHDGYNPTRANGTTTRKPFGPRQQAKPQTGLKPKDLVGIPWRVAFALQADGWYLRSDIIWSKPNPMPESVTDRPTKSHEYLFLLSKSARYFYDADAVREPHSEASLNRYTYAPSSYAVEHADVNAKGRRPANGVDHNPAGRNLRSVWSIATAPYPGAHFATFPPKLVEPCIKAGTSEKGVCPECGAPWVREVEKRDLGFADRTFRSPHRTDTPGMTNGTGGTTLAKIIARDTQGWRPTCRCGAHDVLSSPVTEVEANVGADRSEALDASQHRLSLDPVPATVLDPFAGSGTTGMVAQSLSRRAILIDLSMDYLDQLMKRNRDIPLGLDVA